MAMQSPEARFLEAVFNHVSLPPRLPGRQEGNLDRIDRALVERVLDAVARLSPILANNALEPLRRSLQACKHVNTGGRLAKSSLLTAFRELPVNPTDFLLLHVAEQNAALIIRCQKEDAHGEEIIFEAFEASPVSEDVLAAEGALQWDFPGNAVAIPLDTFNDPKFQEELATFLEKASVESIKRFAARAKKAGSSAYESRGTVDPSLVTQMLMSLLAEIGGRRVFPTLLRKHVRDDVLWENGSEKPWRRSPFWLALRVSIHRYLSQSKDSGIGRAQYKFMMCLSYALSLLILAQGRENDMQRGENDIILVDLTPANEHHGSILGFLQRWSRMNVALTRAHSALWIVGNFDQWMQEITVIAQESHSRKWALLMVDLLEMGDIVDVYPMQKGEPHPKAVRLPDISNMEEVNGDPAKWSREIEHMGVLMKEDAYIRRLSKEARLVYQHGQTDLITQGTIQELARELGALRLTFDKREREYQDKCQQKRDADAVLVAAAHDAMQAAIGNADMDEVEGELSGAFASAKVTAVKKKGRDERGEEILYESDIGDEDMT
ncbi:hypothetical protein LZ554_008308 [Drepanopeziza brunnea f. sp. 'monogermtubi']|nr:hypothetical protein LZ554_008308 [Drepanopeziza brunnea f. sp. 'monogermtubi']